MPVQRAGRKRVSAIAGGVSDIPERFAVEQLSPRPCAMAVSNECRVKSAEGGKLKRTTRTIVGHYMFGGCVLRATGKNTRARNP